MRLPAMVALRPRPRSCRFLRKTSGNCWILRSKEKIDLTFVGPEVPLSLGIVDVFREKGLKIIGPNAANAQPGVQQDLREAILQGQRDPDRRLLGMRHA